MSETAVFTLPQIAKLCGAQYRTLHSWVERGLLAPTIQKSNGSGTRDLFSVRDAGVAQVLSGLRKRGLGMDALEAVAAELKDSDLVTCPVCESTVEFGRAAQKRGKS